MMDISFPNELGKMSASSCSQEMCFYSAPSSPSRLKLRPSCGFHTCPTTPRAYEEDANSNLDDFEFETGHSFNLSHMVIETNQKDVNTFHHQQRFCEDSMPAMAFADELFSNGRVLPLLPPLKLPPRLLQNGDGNMVSTQSSRMVSPRSPGLMLRLPFSRHSLWDDEFDPFMEALEKVKEEKKRGKTKAKHGIRRTRSLSPLRGFNNKSEKHVGQSQSNQPKSHCGEVQKEPFQQASRRVNLLSEPEGLVFTRQVRQMGEGNHRNFEAQRISVSKLARETKKDENQRGGFWTRNRKKGIIKKLLFGSGKKGKASSQHNIEDKKEEPEKPPLLRKLDIKSMTQLPQWNKDEATAELSKMRLVCHRPVPRFFLCLGYE